MERYVYDALAPGPNNIRLIRLLPGANKEDIKCEVFTYTLRLDRVSALYEALSYCWGDPAACQRINIKNTCDVEYHYLDVTINLYTALKRLRDPDLERILWIDAIAIDQNNLEERAFQVSFMDKIFGHAAYVNVWLGEEEDGGEVFDSILYAAEENSIHPDVLNSETGIDRLKPLFCGFLERPWFHRIWILQEVATARFISILCGKREATGPAFVAGIRSLADKLELMNQESLLPVHSVLRLMTKDQRLRSVSQDVKGVRSLGSKLSPQLLPMAELLDMFCAHAATDRRDKVYALMGLSNDLEDSDIRVDYTKTWSTLFAQTIRHVVGPLPTIHTWDHHEQAVIIGRGCPIGVIKLDHDDRDFMTIHSPVFRGIRGQVNSWTSRCSIPHQSKVRNGDILCSMEGSRNLSIIRLCDDHFDVVVLAAPTPNEIFLKRRMGDRVTVAWRQLPWQEFSPCISTFSKNLVLIWDWLPNDQSTKMLHAETIGNFTCREPKVNLSRRLDTISVLDSLDQRHEISKLLAAQYLTRVPEGFKPRFEKLDFILGNWALYTKLKKFISQLQWVAWMARTQDLREPVLDYWIAHGTICWNYCEDTQILLDQERPLGIVRIVRPDRSKFGVSKLTPLIRNLFPSCMGQANGLQTATISEVSKGVYNGNYLMHIILGQHMEPLKYSGSTFKILAENSYLHSAATLYLAVVLEMNYASFLINQDLLIDTCRFSAPNPVLDIVMSEVYLHPESIYDILVRVKRTSVSHEVLREGEYRNREALWHRFYKPCMRILYQCIEKSKLLEVMIAHWDAGSENTVSVLQDLCETYAFFAATKYRPIELLDEESENNSPDWFLGNATWKRDEPQEMMVKPLSITELPDQGALPWRSARVDCARSCILGAIKSYREPRTLAPSTYTVSDDKHSARSGGIFEFLVPLMLLRGFESDTLPTSSWGLQRMLFASYLSVHIGF